MTTMIAKEEFLKKVKSEIDFSKEEKRRITLLFAMIFTYIVLLLLLGLSAYGIFHFFTSKITNITAYIILGLMFLCVILFGIIPKIQKVFYILFKNELKEYLINHLFSKFEIQKLSSFDYDYQTNIKRSNIFADFSNSEFDDIIGNDYFTAIETTIFEKDTVNWGTKEIKTTSFKGLIILFNSNKRIKARTVVVSKQDINIKNFLNPKNKIKVFFYIIYPILIITPIMLIISRIDIYLNTPYLIDFINSIIVGILIITFLSLGLSFYPMIKKLKEKKAIFEKLHLEDISFDKRFKVYSENQIEGRYLVTTAFMDRLYNLQTAFGEDNIKCSFYDDKIMFAISTKKDLFELGDLYHTFGKDIEQFYDQIASIYDMIEYFKLNERTGL